MNNFRPTGILDIFPITRQPRTILHRYKPQMMKKYLLCLLSLCCAQAAYAQMSPVDSGHTPYNITFTGFSGDTASALKGLRSELAEILPDTKYRRMTPSCKIVFYEPDNSLHPIYAVNPTLPVLPASVEK